MSLKWVHLIFIISAVLVSVFFGVWAYRSYLAGPKVWLALSSVLAFLLAVALAGYWVVFFRKARKIKL